MSAATSLASFLDAPEAAGGIVVVTGAGISLASGIPTFRGTDAGAIWKRDVLELGTYAYFEEDPVGSWRWYLSRFDGVLHASPNPAHYALAALERWQTARGGRFLLATQNVDTLHENAGSTLLVKIHGSADRFRCTLPGCENAAPSGSIARAAVDCAPFLAEPSPEQLPTCPACGSLLRQHVLWFDETYDSHDDYQFRRLTRAADDASRILFIGTSFAVGATEAVLRSGRYAGARMMSIDPGDHPPPRGVEALRARAEEVLPDAVNLLAAPE